MLSLPDYHLTFSRFSASGAGLTVAATVGCRPATNVILGLTRRALLGAKWEYTVRLHSQLKG